MKITDSEITKALECCIDCDCKNCPCQTENGHCMEIDEALILDLINRQKAEIKWLKKRLDMSCKELSRRREMNSSICKLNENLLTERKNAKSEAIKEFANVLTKRVQGIPQHHFCFLSVEESINDLVKEITEAKQ